MNNSRLVNQGKNLFIYVYLTNESITYIIIWLWTILWYVAQFKYKEYCMFIVYRILHRIMHVDIHTHVYNIYVDSILDCVNL